MIRTLSVSHYRSLLDLVIPLGQLTVITGENGTGKSNLYKALRLLVETANGGVVSALAHEGGMEKVFWAGPETLSRAMRAGEVPVQGLCNREPQRLRLGFASDDLSYSISLGLTQNQEKTLFASDPEIKKESIWAGCKYHPSAVLLERKGHLAMAKEGRRNEILSKELRLTDSVFDLPVNPHAAPELVYMKQLMRDWRFYDQFRADAHAPARQPQLGTFTPVLHHDGCDVAAAVQTILEVGDREAFADAIADAFPQARVSVEVQADGRFVLLFHQHGLLRPLTAQELSDGTLRYILLVAALLTPRPPALMVLNEPETSLHADLLPALGCLIRKASASSQIWMVSHSNRLIANVESAEDLQLIRLHKELGQTLVMGQSLGNRPVWRWHD